MTLAVEGFLDGGIIRSSPAPSTDHFSRRLSHSTFAQRGVAQGGRPIGPGEARAADTGPALEAVAETLAAAPGLLSAGATLPTLAANGYGPATSASCHPAADWIGGAR